MRIRERANGNLVKTRSASVLFGSNFLLSLAKGEGGVRVAFLGTACRKPLTSILSPRERVEADSCEADIVTHRSSLTADRIHPIDGYSEGSRARLRPSW